MAADTFSQKDHSHKEHSHKEYLDAFQQFMQTGEKEQLAPYLEASRPDAFLSVYRNGFIRASASALEGNFPSVVALWGEDYFSQVAASYVQLTAPSSATLIGYGFDVSDDKASLSFIDHLQQNLPELIEQYPFVPDLCRLDQAWLESLNENGESFLTLPEVQEMVSEGVDLAELPLRLVDSSRIVSLEFELFELWGQLRFGDQQTEQKVELNAHNNSVIFWQMELQVQAKPLSAVEAVFMKSLKQSADFDTASSQAMAIDDTFEISSLFAELLTANLIQQ